MRPVRVTVTGIAVSPPIVLDHSQSPGTVAIGVIISATATYTVEHTFDDVFAPTFTPGTATWLPHSTLAAKTSMSFTAPARQTPITSQSKPGMKPY